MLFIFIGCAAGSFVSGIFAYWLGYRHGSRRAIRFCLNQVLLPGLGIKLVESMVSDQDPEHEPVEAEG